VELGFTAAAMRNGEQYPDFVVDRRCGGLPSNLPDWPFSVWDYSATGRLTILLLRIDAFALLQARRFTSSAPEEKACPMKSTKPRTAGTKPRRDGNTI
jgi:hypothetical protein